jgi:hypothetical protein
MIYTAFLFKCRQAMQKEMFIANLWLKVSCYSTAASEDIQQMFYQMFG